MRLKQTHFFTKKDIQIVVVTLFCAFAQIQANAQCQITIEDSVHCVNSIAQFKANAPGFNSYTWDFGNGRTSSERDPALIYDQPGTYKVKMMASGAPGNCNSELTITIRPIPDIKLNLLSSDTQCFKGNAFLFVDSTKASSGVDQQIYRIDDGAIFDTLNPTFPVIFSKTIFTPTGGSFSVFVESIGSNGCSAKKNYKDIIHTYPVIGVKLSGNSVVGCDSTTVTLKNETIVGLTDLKSFTYQIGPDNIQGDSNTNADYYNGPNNDRVLHHVIRDKGVFDVSLEVETKNGCKDSDTLKSIAQNDKLEVEIVADDDTSFYGQGVRHFSLKNGPISGAKFLWNFGDPSSGSENLHNKSWQPNHRFGPGAYMVSLGIRSGGCDKVFFDTIWVQGPQARIETVNDRIAFDERYQCQTNDTIHFTNNSVFYRNDSVPADEDSVVVVNGRSVFAFNYDPISRLGDQTALTTPTHIKNRSAGLQVMRLWDFGDVYAEQCTMDSKNNINTNKNCNYSRDKYPTHVYPNWDSVYTRNHYLTNDTFYVTKFVDSTRICKQVIVDTSMRDRHRTLFYRNKTHNFTATLTLIDTAYGQKSKSQDQISIYTTRPDASKMTLESGIPCALSGNLKYYLEFNLNTGSQSYLAINYDSLVNPSRFVNATSGNVMAPPAPGSPIPFVMPYDKVGAYPDRFIKGYTKGEVGNRMYRKHGSFTLGVIVGNGPIGPNGEPPKCVDTCWYPHLFRINTLNAKFQIHGKSKNPKSVCKGSNVYFEIEQPVQDQVKLLRWNYGMYNHHKTYYEDFHYLEPYTGPSQNRNDKDVSYNNENWYYNYVVRHTLSDFYGDQIMDTLVTRIVKDWKLLPSSEFIKQFNETERGVNSASLRNRWRNYLGDGTTGCIDTTGFASEFKVEDYRVGDGTGTYAIGNKRYRYLNPSHTDSIEVAQILHFRDSSLRGFDTSIVGTDTTFGVWKVNFDYDEEVINPDGTRDTISKPYSGVLEPNLDLYNRDGCSSYEARLLTSGFLMLAKLEDDIVCTNSIVELEDSVRYWQYGDETWPKYYPINPKQYWQDPMRYVTNKEILIVDWDASDGLNDFERSIKFFHQYEDTGRYEITMVGVDSMGCTDTVRNRVTISNVRAKIDLTDGLDNCKPKVSVKASPTIYQADTNSQVAWQEWKFGDGSPRSNQGNTEHVYSEFGEYRMVYTVHSSLGCEDSVVQIVDLNGPKPLFRFDNNPDWNATDTAHILVGENLILQNLSTGRNDTANFVMHWGDGKTSSPGPKPNTYKHVYSDTGIYNLYLDMTGKALSAGATCTMRYPNPNPSIWDAVIHEVVVVRPDTTNSIRDLNSDIKVFANPNSGRFTVLAAGLGSIEHMELINTIGVSIDLDVKVLGSGRYYLQANEAPNGYYILQLTTSSGKAYQRVGIFR